VAAPADDAANDAATASSSGGDAGTSAPEAAPPDDELVMPPVDETMLAMLIDFGFPEVILFFPPLRSTFCPVVRHPCRSFKTCAVRCLRPDSVLLFTLFAGPRAVVPHGGHCVHGGGRGVAPRAQRRPGPRRACAPRRALRPRGRHRSPAGRRPACRWDLVRNRARRSPGPAGRGAEGPRSPRGRSLRRGRGQGPLGPRRARRRGGHQGGCRPVRRGHFRARRCPGGSGRQQRRRGASGGADRGGGGSARGAV